MDTRRPYGADGAGDASDDLISELARLVGQDARASGQQRREPPLDRGEAGQPHPSPPAPEKSAPVPSQAASPERAEPHLIREGGAEGRRALEDFEFDFGFGPSASEATPPARTTPAASRGEAVDDDPIAALIADADQEALRAEEERWSEDARSSEDAETPASARRDVPPSTAAAVAGHVASDPVAQAPVAPDAREIRDRDPLSEIEALIGEAARVNIEPGPMGARRVRSVYAPAEPALPAAPERSEPESLEPDYAEDGLSPAEKAIMAATASSAFSRGDRATDASPAAPAPRHDDDYLRDDALDTGEYDELAEEEQFVERRRSRRRSGLLVPAALGSLVLAGLVGGYVMIFGQGAGEGGDAPVLVADSEPAKVEPEPTNTSGTTGDSLVFSDIEGQTADPAESTLVSRDETDGASGQAVSSLLAGTPEEGETGLANRSVRTVTVRPDGTIVASEDEAAAGSSILPVDRPDVPEIPGNAPADDLIGATIAEALGESAGGSGTGASVTPGDAGSEGPTTVAEADPALPALDPASGSGDVSLPLPRPGDLPTATAATVPDAAENDAAETETDAGVTGPVGAWVQLASQRSEAAARAGVADLERRYGVLFNGTPLDVSPVDLGENGVYYRVRLPQPTLADANSVCDTIRAAEGDCFVMSN